MMIWQARNMSECFKVFYVKLYVHLLVDTLKWVNYSVHKSPTTVPILSQINPVHAPTLRSMLLFSRLRLGLPRGLLPTHFPIRTLCVFPFSPMHAPPISFSSIWSPEWHMMIGPDHDAVQYAVFFCHLRPSYTQMSPSSPRSRTPSAYIPPSLWETKFHTHMKQQIHYELVRILFIFCI